MKISPCEGSVTIQFVRDLCGASVANQVVDHFGGRVLFIPKKPSANSRLARALEADALTALCTALGGETIVVPIGRNSALRQMRGRVEKLLLDGRSISDIANGAGCSRRTVYRLKAEMRDAGELPQANA